MEENKSSLRAMFNEAAEITNPADREAFVNQACNGDPRLKERLNRLLEADEQAGNFLRDHDTRSRVALPGEKIGDRIGRYRLVENIGRGGCGVVYLAEQEEPVRRKVALKIIKLGMDTASVVARFEAERQALAMMDHPNIARVLDAGATDEGRPFFVMELVSGVKINEYCESKHLSVQERLELLIPVCQAVQHAHQKGVIHRDLKPSNILVTEHEGLAVPKVIDFGIAKATGPAEEFSGVTSVDQIIGTPAYMSPEQVEFGGRDIDTRSDIYSLGVILYELLTGQPPFNPRELAGAGLEEMRRIIREVDPPRPSTSLSQHLNPARLPSARNPYRDRLASVRGDLDWIVMKCLEKDRARRYETANGLATDIRRHLENEPVAARPPSRLYRLQKIVRRNRLTFGAIGLVALIMVVAVVVSTRQALRARHAEQAQQRLRGLAEASATESRQRLIRRYVSEGNRLAESGQQLSALSWMVEALALEGGDAQRESDERLRIAQSMIGAPELRVNISQGKVVNCVALSPDGSRLASGNREGLVLISDVTIGSVITNLALSSSVEKVAFSPDGATLVGIDSSGAARIWSVGNGAAMTPVLRPTAAVERDSRFTPSACFSPDGKSVLLVCGGNTVDLRDAGTGELQRQFFHNQLVYQAGFSRDGKWIFSASKDRTARVWDAVTGEPASEVLQHSGPVISAQFSEDGNQLLTDRDRHFVEVWDWRSGRTIAPEIPRRSNLSHASLSPDGKTILTTARSGYGHLYDAATSRLMYQFQQPGGITAAAFSPNGRHIAIAGQDGNVWLREPNDASSHPVVLPEGNQIEEIAFSKDGRFLAVGTRGGHSRVWDLQPGERGVLRLPGNVVQWVEFDPAGRLALVLSTESKSGIGVFDARSGAAICNIAAKPNQFTTARFSPDGTRILAFGKAATVFVYDAQSGGDLYPPLRCGKRPEEVLWSRDGKLILTAAAAVLRGWNAGTGKLSATFSNQYPVMAMAVSPDGSSLATAHADNRVRLWAMAGGKPVRELAALPGKIRQVGFAPDNQRIAVVTGSSSGESIVQIREIKTDQIVGHPLMHRDQVNDFEFSRDGKYIATACNDHSARIWMTDTGEPVSNWLIHDYEARQALFSSDGMRLATLARRGAARLWTVRTGEPITPPIVYPRVGGDGCISYSPTGDALLIARGGNEAWLRPLQPDTATLEELRLRAQVLSCTRFDSVATTVPLDEAALDVAWKKLGAYRTAR